MKRARDDTLFVLKIILRSYIPFIDIIQRLLVSEFKTGFNDFKVLETVAQFMCNVYFLLAVLIGNLLDPDKKLSNWKN